MNKVYEEALKFLDRYSSTIAFRVKEHSKVIETHLDEDEELKYVFVGQKNEKQIQFPHTTVIALTNKRMLFGRKRLLFGYVFYAVTPNMLNDVKVWAGLIWGKLVIDTVKEVVVISNLSKKSLDEVETALTKYMIEQRDSIK